MKSLSGVEKTAKLATEQDAQYNRKGDKFIVPKSSEEAHIIKNFSYI